MTPSGVAANAKDVKPANSLSAQGGWDEGLQTALTDRIRRVLLSDPTRYRRVAHGVYALVPPPA